MNRSALPLVWGRCGRVRLWRGPLPSIAPAWGTLVLGQAVADDVLPAVDPVAAAIGDPAKLLVVLVDERSRVIVDVAHRDARQPIGISQPGVAGPGEHGV